jgi:ethanolamine-phosphate cytidylyltransferase
VTSLPWITHYGCWYVVHGDDITSDSNGEDCYRFVKAAGRFKVVKRTPGISTTDLVGRMLLCTRSHFIRSLEKVLTGEEGDGGELERQARGEEMAQRIREYASDESGHNPSSEVWSWNPSKRPHLKDRTHSSSGSHRSHRGSHGEHEHHHHVHDDPGTFSKMVSGKEPKPSQRVVYVDGGFDLFSSGHIEFLRSVIKLEEEEAVQRGWYTEEAKKKRIEEHGGDFAPAYVLAGVHDDEVINRVKGINYPIMNIFERGLCVLQCKVSRSHLFLSLATDWYIQYVQAVVFSAPYTPTTSYLKNMPYGVPAVVYHGPTAFMPMLNHDPYTPAKSLGIFHEVPAHEFQHVNAGEIVERIMKSRAMYEERQRVKGVKGLGEEAVKRREDMENELKERERQYREVERSYGL